MIIKKSNGLLPQNKQQEKLMGIEKKKSKGPMHYPQVFLFHMLLVVIAIWLLTGVFMGITSAPNDDMAPRISTGDLLLFYRLDKDVKAQDVIVFNKNDTTYVSRVVAVGGDTVDITDDQRLKINGNIVVEERIYYKTPKYQDYLTYPITLEANECFVLSDKRIQAEDSRYFGPVSKDEIQGTVISVLRKNNL